MKNNKIKAMLVVLLFGATFLALIPTSVLADAPDGFSYYKTINIADANNSYQMFVNISYAAGNDVNCSSHCNANFSDVQFWDKDNTTQLDFWIEKKVNSDYAWTWIELPSDVETDNMIIMYYGKVGAAPLSNGSNTFPVYFDDWTTNNTADWTANLEVGSKRDYYSVELTGIGNCSDTRLHYKMNISEWNGFSTGESIYLSLSGNNASSQEGTGEPDNISTLSINTDTDIPGVNATHWTFWKQNAIIDGVSWSTLASSSIGYNENENYIIDNKWSLSGQYANSTIRNYTTLALLDYGQIPAFGANWTMTGDFLMFNTYEIANGPSKFQQEKSDFLYVYKSNDAVTTQLGIWYDYMFISKYLDTEPSVSSLGEETAIGGETGAWTDGWTIGTASCSSTGYLFGNWTKSEHIAEGTLDELWTSANDSHWNISDDSSWWGGNYTYYASTTGVNHTMSVLNNSGTNRSQAFGWVHHNDTEVDVLFPYIIFAYSSSTDFDVITWTSTEAFAMHWNGTNMTDIATGDPVIDPTMEATDISDQWFGEGVYLNDEGNYYKYIYNELAGTIKFKWWGNGAFNEPAGWTVQYQHTNLTHDTARCHGIGFWNPYERETTMQWDLMNIWQLNYTVNESAWCNISDYNESRPHMNFPVIDLGTWTEEIMTYFNASAAGNLSANTIRDIMKDNITNPMNTESRMFEQTEQGTGQQNDTVYYYSMILDNFSAFDAETLYDEWLHLHVQMCPEDGIDTNDYGDIIVGIDVDNNRVWDANDRVYWAYADDDYIIWEYAANGEGEPIPVIYDAYIWESDPSAIGNLHRYNTQLNYVLNIPLADLVTSSSVPLNVSDVFGLSILSTVSGELFDEEYAAVWQNWNETSEEPFITEEDSFWDVSNYFMNCSEDSFLPNATSLGRWGEGEITGTMDASGTISYNMSINASFDDSYSIPSEDYSLLNVSINVTNTGAGNLTEIYLNVTWWNCSCSDLNMTFVSSNQDISNFTWYNDSCYVIIRNVSNEPLTPASSWDIWYVVNITACPDVNKATETISITGNASEISEDVTVTGDDSPSFKWGYTLPESTEFNVDALAAMIMAFIAILVAFALLGLFMRWLGEAMR